MNKLYKTIDPKIKNTELTINSDQINLNIASAIKLYEPFIKKVSTSTVNSSEEKINNLNQTTLLTQNSYNFLQTVANNKLKITTVKNKKDNIFNYLKSLSSYSPFLRKRGISINYLQNKSYFFNNKPNVNINYNIFTKNKSTGINLINQTYTIKLLKYFFKSIYCIISKPVFLVTPDRIIIQLFYYLNIPKYKKFRWFSIFYNKNIKSYFMYLNRNLKYKKGTKFKKFKLGFFYKLNIKNRYFKFRFKKAILNLKKRYFNFNKKMAKNFIFKLFCSNLNKIYNNKFKIICDILSNKFNKPVELHLTRLHYPYHDSNILVNLLAMNLKNKRKKSRVLIKKIFKKRPVKNLNNQITSMNNFNNSNINSGKKRNLNSFIRPGDNNIAFLSGLNIKIAGRLMREPIIPRITTKTFEKGARAPGKVNFLDNSSFTGKNKKGAFTIKISSGQNLYI